jgi:hypothetical protein
MSTGIIEVCPRCKKQRPHAEGVGCNCRIAVGKPRWLKVPVLRVSALRVPLEAATGLLEELSNEALHEVLWDLQAEVSRRLLKRETQEQHA